MERSVVLFENKNEQGSALLIVLLSLALLTALAMGMSLTAISELGVTTTYSNQAIALQAAEAGLNHATSLVSDYQGVNFTQLLDDRGATFNENYLLGNNPFLAANAGRFATGAVMIEYEDAVRGFQLRDGRVDPATGLPMTVADAFYRVSVIDDEPSTATQRPTVPNFNPTPTWPGIEDDNDPRVDLNNRLVVYSTGTYANSSVILEGWVAFLPYPAFSANGDITVWGNADINGTYGGVHSNSNLEVGSSVTIDQTATASGTATINSTNIGGFSGGGQTKLDIPPFVTTDPVVSSGPATSPRLQDFLIRAADRLLIDPAFADKADPTSPTGSTAGTSTRATARLANLAQRLNVSYASLVAALDSDPANTTVDQSSPVAVEITRLSDGSGVAAPAGPVSSLGWTVTSGEWNITSMASGNHTYYVVGEDNYNLSNPSASSPNGGNVSITGNTGTPATPLQITIMATGSIEITGNPNIVANLRDLNTPLLPPFVRVDVLLSAVEDIKINGDTDGAQTFSGISFAGEQVELSGNGAFDGQVIALSNPNVRHSPVDSDTNSLTGNFTLTLNDGRAIGKVKLYSWRQIKK